MTVRVAVSLLATVLLGFTLLFQSPALRTSFKAAAQSPGDSPQTLDFAHWSQQKGFDSSVFLNNAGARPLTVTPVLYNTSGGSLAVAPLVLQPREQIEARISDWLAQSGASASFEQGSLSLTYEAMDAAFLGAQVKVFNQQSSLSFDVPSEKPAQYGSSRLEGLWWRPDGEAEYSLVLTNTSSGRVAARVTFTGDLAGRDRPDPAGADLTLEAHQSRLLHESDFHLPFSSGDGEGKAGGISITHQGPPGALLAYGMLAKAETGFSSSFHFADPSARRSQRLTGAHLLVGDPDIPGFAPQTEFTSVAWLRNSSDATIEVAPEVSFSSGGSERSVRLDTMRLSPQQVQAVNVNEALKELGFRGPFAGTGLTLESTGEPGALVAHLTSFDQTGNQVFDVPLKDPAVAASHFGGSYPWKIDSETESIIHVRNTTDEKASFLLQIDYDSGSYTLPAQVLGPSQQRAVNLRQLRDGQVKDSIGRVIPLEVERGQATWIENGRQALTGRIEIFSVSAAVASSLSCQIPANNTCCPPETFEVFLAPNVLTTSVGSTSFLQFLERRRRECDGAMFGPFDVTAQAVWSSSNTAVATVGAVTADGCPVNSIAPGHANVHADYNGASYTPDSTEPNCVLLPVPFPADCPIDVLSPTLTVSPSPVTRGSSATFTINNVASGAQISGWKFSDGTNTVNRSVGSTSTIWSGIMVVGGTVSVTVVQGGMTFPLSTNITVNARTGFARLAVLPTEVANGFNCENLNGDVLTIPSPPTSAGDGTGRYCLRLVFNIFVATVSDDGPNHGYKYVTSFSDSGNGMTTGFFYLISADLKDSNSAFSKAQCGNYDPIQNPNGYISASALLENTIRHEASLFQSSHWHNYQIAQDMFDNNLGAVAEAETADPSKNQTDFKQSVLQKLVGKVGTIGAATDVEPLAPNRDASGNFLGNVNFTLAQCQPQ